MKKNIIAAALVASAVMSASALAADGTVNFNGNITDEVCTVTPGTKDQTVDMRTWGTNAFPSAGATVTGTDFKVILTDCPASVAQKGVAISFDGIANNGDTAVLALSDDSTATNVGIQISDSNNKVVKLREDSSKYAIQEGSVLNTLTFTARYISTAATVTAGTANAVAQFSINYQ